MSTATKRISRGKGTVIAAGNAIPNCCTYGFHRLEERQVIIANNVGSKLTYMLRPPVCESCMICRFTHSIIAAITPNLYNEGRYKEQV